tara:strand:- start:598 stop:1107 length:510 start_codon:yes stop_codon:yes gene_type:complete
MPQFDPAVFPAQIFWLVIFFTILMIYTVAVSVPRLKQLLEERWQKTEGYRIETGRLKEEKQSILDDVESGLNKTREKARGLMAATLDDVDKSLSERKKSMVSLLKTQLEATELSIAEEKEKAVLDIKRHTQLITYDIIAKLLPMAGGQVEGNIEVLVDDKLNLKVSNGI